MKIKRLLVLAVLPMLCLAVNAQSSSKDNTPKKGDFTVAATVGYNSYTNVTAPSGLLTDYEVRALSTNWADKKLMVGFEGGWFFKDQWKLNLGGGVSFTNNPGYPAVPGTIDDSNKNNSADENMGEIPNYRAVADAQSFAYFLDEMTTVNIKNFETLPSVLREYKVGFVLLTQSGAKLEALYGKLDRASVEANFGIQFFGRTKDVEALKYYPQMFGKEEKERKSRSTGKSGSSSNRSVTISSQKEDIYQGRDFADLEPGEFIGSATRANVRYFKVMLGEFKEKDEKPLPDVRVLEPGEISGNFARILEEVRSLFPCE